MVQKGERTKRISEDEDHTSCIDTTHNKVGQQTIKYSSPHGFTTDCLINHKLPYEPQCSAISIDVSTIMITQWSVVSAVYPH
jgi:hypothetical protein